MSATPAFFWLVSEGNDRVHNQLRVTRAGTAYRLKDGNIVYLPEPGAASEATVTRP